MSEYSNIPKKEMILSSKEPCHLLVTLEKEGWPKFAGNIEIIIREINDSGTIFCRPLYFKKSLSPTFILSLPPGTFGCAYKFIPSEKPEGAPITPEPCSIISQISSDVATMLQKSLPVFNLLEQ